MDITDGIKLYNRVRYLLENIYLYGFFSREDYARMGFGTAKSYDYGSKLIRSIFPETEEDAVWKSGKKYMRFQRDYARSGENRMTDSYLLYPMDEKRELPELFSILSKLSGGACALDELTCMVEQHTPLDEDASKYSTVRRRAEDLVENGYAEKVGKQYRLVEPPWCALPDHELDLLCDYVRFAAGVSYPRVAGSFLLRTLNRERLRRGMEPLGDSPFLLRHSVNRNVFDEEILYQLMEAIQDRRTVQVILNERGCPQKRALLPVVLRADVRLGRWYLLAWDLRERKPLFRRLSAIQTITAQEVVSSELWSSAYAAVTEVYQTAGCSGYVPESGPVLVEAKLCFEHCPGMRYQFQRELRLGEIVSEQGVEYYRALVNDPLELLPLLRSFSPWIRILPGAHDLDRRLWTDLTVMKKRLGAMT